MVVRSDVEEGPKEVLLTARDLNFARHEAGRPRWSREFLAEDSRLDGAVLLSRWQLVVRGYTFE